MSQSNEDDLVALQRVWYKKLKDSGFEDIEDVSSQSFQKYVRNKTEAPNLCLYKYHSKLFHSIHPVQFEASQEYFRQAQSFYHAHEFESSLDKKVWGLHSEGYSHRKIANALRTAKNTINKDSVNQIILRLQQVMRDLEGVLF